MSSGTQVLPETSVTETTPGAAFAPTGLSDVVLFVGPSSKGTVNRPTVIGARDIAGLTATFGTGPTVKEAAYFASQVGVSFVFLRAATATVAGAVHDNTVTRDVSSDFTHTTSGTISDGGDVVIWFTLGGTTGTGPITYKVSTDGGTTYGSPVSLGTATTITVNGCVVALGSGKIITTDDKIFFWLTPPSSSILTQTSALDVGSTSTLTASGTPEDAYDVVFEIGLGGTRGTAGITYRYSLNGGGALGTYTPWQALGTNTSVTLVDGPLSAESTGITIAIGVGTLTAGDKLTFKCSGPQYDSSGITAAIGSAQTATTSLAKWNGTWTWMRIVGEVMATLAASVDTLVLGWLAKGRPTWAVCDARDRVAGETLLAWKARLETDFTSYASTRTGVSAGMRRVTCPINGRRDRRPAMCSCMPRAGALPIQVDWAQFDLGPLPDGHGLIDENLAEVEHNANTSPDLQAMGFITLRTWPGEDGVYPTGAQLLGPNGDIQRVPLRRVKNVADILYGRVLRLQAVKSFRVNPTGSKGALVPGNLHPVDEAKINRLGQDIIGRGTVSQGMASAIVFAVNPTPISLGGGVYQLKATLQITPLIYVMAVDGTSSFVAAERSPTLSLSGTVTQGA